MQEERIKRAEALVEKLEKGTVTPDERRVLDRAFLRLQPDDLVANTDDSYQQLQAEAWRRLLATGRFTPAKHTGYRQLRPYFSAAALIVAMAIGFWFYRNQTNDRQIEITATEIQPGGNRATLTLADGRTIDLSAAQTGIVVQDGITYLDGSQVVAHEELSAKDEKPTLNSIATPKGGTYQITLPDGSKVWLNAASTLTYPSRFDDNERVLELVGEGYFEIVKDTRRPFRLRSEGQVVEVLGTAFNIAAYPDDTETKTTLVEGKVRVEANGSSLQLVPGEQGMSTGGELTKHEVNTDQYTAWKTGIFSFQHTDLHSVMRQLARWYDVEVAYEGNPNYKPFYGSIERSYNLGEVLEVLKLGNVNFRLERPGVEGGRPRVVVLPNTE